MKEQRTAVSEEESSVVDKNSKTKLVEFTDVVGGNGKWQVKLMIFSIFSQFFSSFHHLVMSFLAYPVDHWCARPDGSNVSLDVWLTEFPNTTIKGLSHHSQCEEYTVYNSTMRELALVNYTTKPCDSWEYSSEFNSVVNHWGVVCEKEWWLSTSQSVYMLGFLCASMISGQFSDMYGRHLALMVCVVIFLVSGILVAFAQSFLMFCVFRFFVALGVVGMDLVLYIIRM